MSSRPVPTWLTRLHSPKLVWAVLILVGLVLVESSVLLGVTFNQKPTVSPVVINPTKTKTKTETKVRTVVTGADFSSFPKCKERRDVSQSYCVFDTGSGDITLNVNFGKSTIDIPRK